MILKGFILSGFFLDQIQAPAEKNSMKKILSLLLFLACCLSAFSQNLDASVNFRKNKDQLTNDAKKILDNLSVSLSNLHSYKLIVKGFSDADAAKDYNLKLSSRRCEAVMNYLSTKGIPKEAMSVFAYGEELSSEELDENYKSKDRRVDIIVIPDQPVVSIPLDSAKTPVPCSADTIIQLSDGVFAKVNACAYLKQKSCITLKSYKEVRYKMKVSRFKMMLGFKRYTRVKSKQTTYRISYSCKDTTCNSLKASLYVPFFETKEKQYTIRSIDPVTKTPVEYKGSKIKSYKKKDIFTCLPFIVERVLQVVITLLVVDFVVMMDAIAGRPG